MTGYVSTMSCNVSAVMSAVEMATLYRENGVTRLRILPADDVTAAISRYEAAEAKAEAEKKKTEKSGPSS